MWKRISFSRFVSLSCILQLLLQLTDSWQWSGVVCLHGISSCAAWVSDSFRRVQHEQAPSTMPSQGTQLLIQAQAQFMVSTSSLVSNPARAATVTCSGTLCQWMRAAWVQSENECVVPSEEAGYLLKTEWCRQGGIHALLCEDTVH